MIILFFSARYQENNNIIMSSKILYFIHCLKGMENINTVRRGVGAEAFLSVSNRFYFVFNASPNTKT